MSQNVLCGYDILMIEFSESGCQQAFVILCYMYVTIHYPRVLLLIFKYFSLDGHFCSNLN